MILLYVTLVTLAMCIAYAFLFKLFPYFFGALRQRFSHNSVSSLAWIVIGMLVSFALVAIAPSQAIGNRLLHAVTGGFMLFFTCFLAARDSRVRIGAFQFFFFSALLVTTFGVANEIAEYVLQERLGVFLFAATVSDTWLDLISNTLGLLVASVCLVPFFLKRK